MVYKCPKYETLGALLPNITNTNGGIFHRQFVLNKGIYLIEVPLYIGLGAFFAHFLVITNAPKLQIKSKLYFI